MTSTRNFFFKGYNVISHITKRKEEKYSYKGTNKMKNQGCSSSPYSSTDLKQTDSSGTYPYHTKKFKLQIIYLPKLAFENIFIKRLLSHCLTKTYWGSCTRKKIKTIETQTLK